MKSRLLNVQVRDLHAGDTIVAGLNMAATPEVMEPGVWPSLDDGHYMVPLRFPSGVRAMEMHGTVRLDIDRPNLVIHGLEA